MIINRKTTFFFDKSFTPWNDLMAMTKTNTKLSNSHNFLIGKIRILKNSRITICLFSSIFSHHRNRLERYEHRQSMFSNNPPFLSYINYPYIKYVEYDLVLIIYEILVVNHSHDKECGDHPRQERAKWKKYRHEYRTTNNLP